MRHKIFNHMKNIPRSYLSLLFLVDLFLKDEENFQPAPSPNKWELFEFYIWSLNTSFEGFILIFLPMP